MGAWRSSKFHTSSDIKEIFIILLLRFLPSEGSMRKFIDTAFATRPLATSFCALEQDSKPAASSGKSGYHQVAKWDVGGDGGWGYLTFDPAGKRLFISRGTHVMVLDADSGKIVGDIADTAGVHGIAIAQDLGK